jgi:Na+/phosphate symporter
MFFFFLKGFANLPTFNDDDEEGGKEDEDDEMVARRQQRELVARKQQALAQAKIEYEQLLETTSPFCEEIKNSLEIRTLNTAIQESYARFFFFFLRIFFFCKV